jgi:glyoxalase/bleomycin resistance protein/dioxygenase superfamily protein
MRRFFLCGGQHAQDRTIGGGRESDKMRTALAFVGKLGASMKKTLLLFILLVPAIVPPIVRTQSAQSLSQPAAFNVTGSFFALSVADAEASAKWYAEKLGLGVAMQLAKTKDSPAIRVMAGGGLIVELIETDALPPGKAAPVVASPERSQGIFKVGIVVENLDQIIAVLKTRDVPLFLGPFPAKENGMRNLIIKDNAGNLIQFFGRK